MRIGLLVFLPVIAAAQSPREAPVPGGLPPGPPPLMRGVLLERDAQVDSGELSVRAADNQVYRFQFDRKTYVEREDQLIDVARLRLGDKVEVVSDKLPASAWRYARTIHVIEDPPPPRPVTAGRLRGYRSPTERTVPTVPTGNLTFSGVVRRLSGERLVLHTRDGGEQAVLLRQDTRYLENGELVDFAALAPNLRVFVLAGKDLYEQVEAYQVIWGKILEPR